MSKSTIPLPGRQPERTEEGEPPLSAVEVLRGALRQRILAGEFQPGEFLRDVRMADEHNTSRHTFRMAAQMLVSQGLLRQIPNRGFFIPTFTPDDIFDITRLRALLEGEAVRTIVLVGNIPVGAIAAVEQMRAATITKDRSMLATADTDFHHAIIAASGSERLQRSYRALESEIELLLVQRQALYSDPQQMLEEHETLIESLRGRHEGRAQIRFAEHWKDLQLQILDMSV